MIASIYTHPAAWIEKKRASKEFETIKFIREREMGLSFKLENDFIYMHKKRMKWLRIRRKFGQSLISEHSGLLDG